MIRLHTERLGLRPLSDEDAAPLAAVNADPEVMRYVGDGRPRTPERTRARIEEMERHWAEHGWGTFAVELADTGEFIGCIVLAVPEFLPEILPAVEVGWRFGRRHWGHGYAPEAAREVIRFAFEDIGMDRLVSCVYRGNTASARVAEKLGMALERETVVPDLEVQCLVYELWARGRIAD